ncbi:PilZ domain-containing protein [Methylorubrum extorquens]|uniref:PilZ domain-containing protein n=2 Tax=Methylorubrum extorquens TaxID=408 RepID=A0AAX3W9L5_METEX|nr:PilZ domain-containing protein [Methylorubrum extorquens]
MTRGTMIERPASNLHTVFLPALCWSRRQPDFYAVTQDLSRTGITFRSASDPAVNEPLTCSIRYIGQVEARVVSSGDNQFVVRLMASRQRAAEVARTMLALAREQGRTFESTRAHPRINPARKDVLVTLEDGRVLPGRLINVSSSGAALAIDHTLSRGASITIGDTAAKVVRIFRDGIGATFAFPLDPGQVHAGIRL